MNIEEIRDKLAEPFPPGDIEWRAGATNQDKTKALALAYLTSRAVMNRLDDVCGVDGWYDSYTSGPSGGVICGISILVRRVPTYEWVTKWDGAENTNFEAVKGGLSDAFKRAGVKWGIGRYLYGLPNAWVPCEQRGNTVILKETPTLPEWALPENYEVPNLTFPEALRKFPGKDDKVRFIHMVERKLSCTADEAQEKIIAGLDGKKFSVKWAETFYETVE